MLHQTFSRCQSHIFVVHRHCRFCGYKVINDNEKDGKYSLVLGGPLADAKNKLGIVDES
jgi:hypothetical protein